MAHRLLAVLALALMAAPATTALDADHTLPLLDSGSGPGWVSYKIATNGSMFSFENTLTGGNGSDTTIILFTEDDRWYAAFSASIVGDEPQFASVRSGIHPGMDLRPTPRPEWNGSIGWEIVFNDPEFGEPHVGTLKILAWAAGDGEFSRVLRGEAGTTIQGQGSGSSVFLADSTRFHGLADADARAHYGLGARAHAQAALTVDVQHELFAFYSNHGVAPQPELLRVTTPQTTTLCPCWIDDIQHGPGTYTFRADGAGAVAIYGELRLRGADAWLPK